MDDATVRQANVIPLEFWTDEDQLPDGTMVSVDWVKWTKVGNPNHGGSDKINRIMKHDVSVWSAIKPYYDAWKKQEGEPIDGTPITNWAGCTKKMAEVLRMNGFRSVEQFAQATDADLYRIGMGGLSLREKAKTFISIKGNESKASAEIVALRESNKILEERVNELLSAMKDFRAEPKKRGRPAKEVEE